MCVCMCMCVCAYVYGCVCRGGGVCVVVAARLLLHNGADINAQTYGGQTALHLTGLPALMHTYRHAQHTARCVCARVALRVLLNIAWLQHC